MDRVTGELDKFCPDAKIIHIDIDPSSISKNVKVDVPIVGCIFNSQRIICPNKTVRFYKNGT